MKLTDEQKRIARKNGLTLQLVNARVRSGWDIERALTTPVRRVLTAKQREIARENGLSIELVHGRLRAKWSIERAITIPKGCKITKEEKAIAESNGLDANHVYSRMRCGWSVKQAINIPLDSHRLVTDEQIETARKNGIEYGTFYSRVANYGWDVEDAMTIPVSSSKGNNTGAHWSKIPKDVKEKAKANGISLSLLHKRLYEYEWSLERAVTQPPRPVLRFTNKQKEQVIKNGLDYKTIKERVEKLKWTVDEAISTPAGEERGERHA
jgi:hypothetical protein